MHKPHSFVGLFLPLFFGLALASTKADTLNSIWDYSGETKIRGVSLGGWFVLEPYITPSLFQQFGTDESKIPIDEYTFAKVLGKEKALEKLEQHWSTYYTESDIKEIKSYGLNLIRIPIGYWAFELLSDDPYVQGQEKYLDQAIQWARTYDLKVWIDMHGVPGSQNGFDNSGKRGRIGWQDSKENIEVSIKALDYIFKKYGADSYKDTVIGIEVVNEPMMSVLNADKVLSFTYDRYYDYRAKYNSNNYFLVQEGFMPVGYWNEQFNNDYLNVSKPFTKNVSSTLINDDYFNGVVIDHHHYEVFTDDQLSKSAGERNQDIVNYAKSLGDEQRYHRSLVGEWSGAITDCAKWLNGVGTGARYDGTFSARQLNTSTLIDWGEESEKVVSGYTGEVSDNYSEELADDFYDESEEIEEDSFDRRRLIRRDDSSSSKTCANVQNYTDFSDIHKAKIRKFIEVQLVQYEKYTAGWIFWNWKTENAIEWDFQKLVKKELFPMPLTDYQYFFTNGTEVPTRVSGSNPGPSARSSSMIAVLMVFMAAIFTY
ncbi:CYFA0S06e03532g1_1 [Cyberlindnera fabianii]|uniref:glucan 1,3-beta-glucosidase n=1 Tax=Cyberlindnera fabianii TaxID=36022 RepID=A0A061AVI1_CYBFA|nr:Sporulation-specific glucan 1,3-beta-glucosidase [Cyberlindnera fabianii]CDR41190.1 CYFA0S06e03532g1_1 [Cyberlindnera fabianii]